VIDFWNFKDVFIVASHYWAWLILALVLGMAVGYVSSARD